MFVEQSLDEQIASFVKGIQNAGDESFKRRFVSMLAGLGEPEWEMLEKMALQLAEGKASPPAEAATIEEPSFDQMTVEELEAEYKKSISGSAQRTGSAASSTTGGTGTEKAGEKENVIL